MKMWRNLIRKIKNQSGFTAVELLIGVALIGIIGGAIGVGVAQTYSGSGLSNNQKTAINNVRTAGDWIVRDAQQARVKESTIVPVGTDTNSGVFVPFDPLAATPDMMMTFIWYEYYPSYSQKKYTRVVYVFELDKVTDGINIYNLKRTEDTGTMVGGNFVATTSGQPVIVAQNLIITGEIGRALYTYQDINTFTITIASRVGSGSSVATETRTFEVRLRPKR